MPAVDDVLLKSESLQGFQAYGEVIKNCVGWTRSGLEASAS